MPASAPRRFSIASTPSAARAGRPRLPSQSRGVSARSASSHDTVRTAKSGWLRLTNRDMERCASTDGARHRHIRPAQQVGQLGGVGHRLISEAVVQTPSSAALNRENAGHQRPSGENHRDIDEAGGSRARWPVTSLGATPGPPRGSGAARPKERFARLMHRPVRVLGGPAARAALQQSQPGLVCHPGWCRSSPGAAQAGEVSARISRDRSRHSS
jgi:hypothetical protein